MRPRRSSFNWHRLDKWRLRHPGQQWPKCMATYSETDGPFTYIKRLFWVNWWECFTPYTFKTKRPWLTPYAKFTFKVTTFVTGGGWAEDKFVELRYRCLGSLDEHNALNGW